MELFKTLRDRFASKQRQRAETYVELVANLTDGKPAPNAEEVTALLEATGHTVDQLESDVALLQHRKLLRAKLDERPALKESLHELGLKMRQLQEQWEAAVAKHKADEAALGRERGAIQRSLQQCDSAEAALRQTADPSIAEHIRKLSGGPGSPLAEVRMGRTALRQEVTRLESRRNALRGELRRAAPDNPKEAVQAVEKQAEELAAELEQKRKELAEQEDAVAKLETARDDLKEEALEVA